MFLRTPLPWTGLTPLERSKDPSQEEQKSQWERDLEMKPTFSLDNEYKEAIQEVGKPEKKTSIQIL